MLLRSSKLEGTTKCTPSINNVARSSLGSNKKKTNTTKKKRKSGTRTTSTTITSGDESSSSTSTNTIVNQKKKRKTSKEAPKPKKKLPKKKALVTSSDRHKNSKSTTSKSKNIQKDDKDSDYSSSKDDLKLSDNLSFTSEDNENVKKPVNKSLSKGFTFPDNGIIIPRNNNRGIPKDSNITYCENNVKMYSNFVDIKTIVEYSLSTNKKQFVSVFVDHTFDEYIVFEYNEDLNKYEVIEEQRINVVVTNRIKNLISRVGSKRMKELKLKYGSSKHNKMNEDVRFYQKSDSVFESGEYYDNTSETSFTHMYPNAKELEGYNKWNFYSMFHTAYQSFSTVLYNYSHRLSNGETVHKCTRVKLDFPESCNCMLVIHGRLVHSGAASKLESATSFNPSHDLRPFAYLSNLKKRGSRVDLYNDPLEPDTVDRGTFQMCGNDCSTCIECETHFLRSQVNHKTIDIRDILLKQQESWKRKKTNRTQLPPKLLLGNMKELGWEVYTGIDINLIHYTNLQSQFRELVIGKGKSLWTGIGSTKRMAFKIDRLLGEQNKTVLNNMSLVILFFAEIREFILTKIEYLGEDVQMDGRALLANFDYIVEQTPHRDFSQTKK